MEQVKTETSTKAIPAQVILAWKLYADHLASVESMLPNRPRLDVPVLYPPDTVTGKIARPISTWLMGCAHTAGSLHFLPTSFGLINNFEKASTISVADVRPIQMTLHGTGIKVFTHIVGQAAANLALEFASEAEGNETAQGIKTSLLHSIKSALSAQYLGWSQLDEALDQPSKEPRWSTAKSLLKHATGWAGNDLSERLDEVYALRSRATF